jgi:hypothetical protein
MPDEHSGGGPHLQAAFLCEKVLQEKDNVLTFVRVVDRFVRPKPNPQMPQIQILPTQVMLVVVFKAGDIGTGKYKVEMQIFKPNTSTPFGKIESEIFFEGGHDQGVNLVSPLVLATDEEGLYWIDVLFEERLITRIPFRVMLAAGPAIFPQQGQPGI